MMTAVGISHTNINVPSTIGATHGLKREMLKCKTQSKTQSELQHTWPN